MGKIDELGDSKSLPFLGDVAKIFSGSGEEKCDQQHNSPQFSNPWVTGSVVGLKLWNSLAFFESRIETESNAKAEGVEKATLLLIDKG